MSLAYIFVILHGYHTLLLEFKGKENTANTLPSPNICLFSLGLCVFIIISVCSICGLLDEGVRFLTHYLIIEFLVGVACPTGVL